VKKATVPREPVLSRRVRRGSARESRRLVRARSFAQSSAIAIIKGAARLILREHLKSPFHGPVLCLGVPDFYLTHKELRQALGQPADDADGSLVQAKQFFEALGIGEITSIDIPGSHLTPDLIHDLNRPFPQELLGRFNLVIDPGTMEHVFDVRAGLTNVVRALAVGGTTVHFVPIYSYNGGYFSINPNVMHDFYNTNGFADVRSFIVMYDRFRPSAGRTRCYPYGPVMEPRHALADGDQVRYSPHLLLFARKTSEPSEIAIPIQHEDEGGSSETAKRIARRFLGPALTTYLAGRVRREIQLRRSRRVSFWI
jgi:hypothetical protein